MGGARETGRLNGCGSELLCEERASASQLVVELRRAVDSARLLVEELGEIHREAGKVLRIEESGAGKLALLQLTAQLSKREPLSGQRIISDGWSQYVAWASFGAFV